MPRASAPCPCFRASARETSNALAPPCSTSQKRGRAIPVSRSVTARTPRRLLDLLVASTALVVLSPFLAAIALAIRGESRRPVSFRQRRLGQGLKPFTVFKFRTMRHEADAAPHRDYVHS